MSGFGWPEGWATLGVWVAAAATLLSWSILVGARRPFLWAQRLLAGMLTGYLALLAIREVLVPRLVAPLVSDPAGNPLAVVALVLGGVLVGSPWLPRWMGAAPVAILVGGTAAFALGGAMVGTVLPQIIGTVPPPGVGLASLGGGLATAVIASLVLIAFLHGAPRSAGMRLLGGIGRWLILGGVGVWLGYLVLARIVLLSDRLAFLGTEWLGMGR